MTPDLKELERLARAATPGPWVFAKDTGSWGASFDDYGSSSYCGVASDEGTVMALTVAHSKSLRHGPDPRPDAAYIAAANPAAILSLIAELEQAKKDAERYQWLRKSHHDDDSAIGVTREHMNGWGHVVGKSLRNSDLDKAIDEAIAKEQS